jgi:biopolymer transport protein ExbD
MNFTRAEERRFTIEGVRLPLIALIDVVLFLLLYFMIAGTSTGDEARLSSALKTDKQGGGRGSDLSSQVLYVEGTGGQTRFRIGQRVMADKAELAPILKQLPKENGIRVRVGPEAKVAAAAAALQACRDAGFEKVSYVPGK